MDRLETKTQKAIYLVKCGDWKQALSIFRTFRIGFTTEDKRLVQIASDVLNGHGQFYKNLGLDVEKVVSDCKDFLNKKYHIDYGESTKS